jgi:hypothetical protein
MTNLRGPVTTGGRGSDVQGVSAGNLDISFSASNIQEAPRTAEVVMKKYSRVFLASCLCLAVMTMMPARGDAAEDVFIPLLNREYRIAVGLPTDMALIASTAVNSVQALSDLYFEGVGLPLPPAIRPVVGIVWQTWWMYLLTIYPHEFGHWSRAREIGGDFIIQGFALPWPKATMVLPAGVDPLSEGLTSVAGFEINALMHRQVMDGFYAHGFAHSDELVFALIQEIYYPGYAFLIAPAVGSVDPADPRTWQHTTGDPMEAALLAFTAWTAKPPVRPDGTVDPDLESFYRECTLMSVVAMFLDPMLYQGVLAFAADMAVNHGLVRPWMMGGDSFAWMYSTLFNPTPMGYELSLANHFRLADRPFSLTLRYGRPILDVGLDISAPVLIRSGGLCIGIALDYFYQDPYGHGLGTTVSAVWDLGDSWSLGVEAGGKTRGYLLGRPIAESARILLEARYRR